MIVVFVLLAMKSDTVVVAIKTGVQAWGLNRIFPVIDTLSLYKSV
jgi:hypothetical protein